MSFQILFALGSLGAGACLALLFFGGEVGAAIAILPLGLGGLICAIVVFASYGESEKQTAYQHRESPSAEDRKGIAALTAPLGLLWLGMWLFQVAPHSFSLGKVIGLLFFGGWFLLIALPSIAELLAGPGQKAGIGVLGVLAVIAVGVWFMSLPTAAEKQVITRFEKEHCTGPGAFAVLEPYQERLSPCPGCIGWYDVKNVTHERIGDKMVLCRVNSAVAFEAACAAKGGETYWRQNAIQTSIFPWSYENYHRACSKDLG